MTHQGKPPLSPPHSPCISWRGADIKNNLISVDITMEGPVHQGIQSTVYVTEAIKEAGLEGEENILVEVTCVLKEFLAQKHLNEPFTGGLSSYGLLLMVLSVVKQATWRTQGRGEEGEDSCGSGSTIRRSWSDIARCDAAVSGAKREDRAGRDAACSPSTISAGGERGIIASHDKGEDEGKWRTIDDIHAASMDSEGKFTVAGLIMHFFYYYGFMFDARTSSIDCTSFNGLAVQRTDDMNSIDPVTGLPDFDPLVIVNPLAGGTRNVAKSCFAFSNLQWFFANSFNCLQLASRGGGDRQSTNPGQRDEKSEAALLLLDLIISF